MDGYKERKMQRTQDYMKYKHGWKLRNCTACNGSGRYDNNGSPKCSSCNGTGKERYKPEKEEPSFEKKIFIEEVQYDDETKLIIDPPMLVKIKFEDDLYIAEAKSFNVITWDKKYENIKTQVAADLCFVWDTYAQCPDDKMTEEAVKLAKRLRSRITKK